MPTGLSPSRSARSAAARLLKTKSSARRARGRDFDAAFGGARRDEERSRAKERIFSVRDPKGQWDPKRQRPELWHAAERPAAARREHTRLSAVELDRAHVWTYIYLENIPVVRLYFAAERPVVERGGMLIMVDDDRLPMDEGEKPTMRRVRFRTLGCYPLSGAMKSNAATVPEIIEELVAARRPNARAASSTTIRPGRWRRRSRKGISDAAFERREQQT